MSRLSLGARLGAATVALGLLAGCDLGADPFNRMYEQIEKKNKAFTHSAVFVDGYAMRTPPPGAVARERELDLEQGMPPITPELLARGKRRYEIVCATCHGLTGESDWRQYGVKDTGSMVSTNFALNPAPSWHQDRLRQKPDVYYYNAMVKGFGYMPNFPEIPEEDRWAVVAYIRALQLSERYAYDKLTPAEQAMVKTAAAAEPSSEPAKEHL